MKVTLKRTGKDIVIDLIDLQNATGIALRSAALNDIQLVKAHMLDVEKAVHRTEKDLYLMEQSKSDD